jgi:hypothetical protein
MRRLLSALVTVFALNSVLLGCSMLPQLACPAIGWVNMATVTLKGTVQKVHTVQLCIEDTCSVTADEMLRQDEPLQLATAIPDAQSAVPTSAPTTVPPIGLRVDDHTWTFQVGMSAPKAVTVRASSADGTVLAERKVTLEWTRVGGTEQCGGPGEAGPVILSSPA